MSFQASQGGTPGNRAKDFYTPQATTTRQSNQNTTPSYFGNNGSTPSYQNFGNTGNPSGLGAGASGLSANGGPGGFMQGMNGEYQVPGSGGNFTWGSTGGYSVPSTGSAYDQYSSNQPSFSPGDTASSTSTAAAYNAQGMSGVPGGGPAMYTSVGGQPTRDRQGEFWQNYANNAQSQHQTGLAQEAYEQSLMAEYMNSAQQRQQEQMAAAGFDPNSQLHWSQQMTAVDGMNAGMPTQQIGQQMTAFGNDATSAPPSDFQSQPQSRYEQMAVDQSRYSGMPVSQLQNIANNDSTLTSLRPAIAEESARLARIELANRGVQGNQMAVGNQQAMDQNAIMAALEEQRGDGPFAPDMLDLYSPQNIMQTAINQQAGASGFMPGSEPIPHQVTIGGVPYAVNTGGFGGGNGFAPNLPGSESIPTGQHTINGTEYAVNTFGQGGHGGAFGKYGGAMGQESPNTGQPGVVIGPQGQTITPDYGRPGEYIAGPEEAPSQQHKPQQSQQNPWQPIPGANPIIGQQPNPAFGGGSTGTPPGTRPTLPVGSQQPQGIPLPGHQGPDDPESLGQLSNQKAREFGAGRQQGGAQGRTSTGIPLALWDPSNPDDWTIINGRAYPKGTTPSPQPPVQPQPQPQGPLWVPRGALGTPRQPVRPQDFGLMSAIFGQPSLN